MSYVQSSSTQPIAMHKITLVQPFVRLLDDIGSPVERGFELAGLSWGALENEDNYVPSHCFWKFLIQMSRAQGIPDLGFRVGQKFGARCADPHMIEILEKAPTLYQGISTANERVNQTVTHCRFGLQQKSNSDKTYFFHSPSCDNNNPALEQIGWFGILALIGMVRVYTGPQWQPTEIGLMTDHNPSHRIQEQFPRTRMRLSQPASYIVLEHSILALPPLSCEATLPGSSPLDFEPLPDDFIGSLEKILLSNIQENNIGINLAAELCNISTRSLQRKLKLMGTNFKEVLSTVRFRAASDMLKCPDVTATEVAIYLGYSDEAHFARAFRRVGGVSPREYRQQFIN